MLRNMSCSEYVMSIFFVKIFVNRQTELTKIVVNAKSWKTDTAQLVLLGVLVEEILSKFHTKF